MKTTNTIETVDKVDVEELIQEFRIMNLDSLSSYLKEVWKVFNINIGSRSP